MVGPWWYHTATIVPRVRNLPFSALRLLIQLTRKPPRQGSAEVRMQNVEFRQAAPMRHQSDIKATSKRVASQAVATPKPPPCDLKATLMRPSCVHKAPTKHQQSHLRANAEGRMQNAEMEPEAPHESCRGQLAAVSMLHLAFLRDRDPDGADGAANS